MNTPELSKALIERHCTVKRKSVNSSFVYQSKPIPPSDSTVSLPTTLKRPKPAICQPSRVGFNRETTPGPGAGFALCAIARAVRRARVKAVGTVFSVPDGQNWTILCRDAAEGLDHCMDCIRRK